MAFHTLLFAVLASVLAAYAVVIDTEGLPDTGLDTSSWTAGQLPPLEDMWTLNDMQVAAKNVITPRFYASYRTAALDEVTYQNNLNIWKNVRLNGFSFRDVSNFSMETSILGYNFSAPFFIAPAANVGHTSSSAELSLATAAGKANLLYVPSISSTKSLEQIAAAGLEDQVMFHQEYIWTNRTQLIDELRRMENSGYKAIFLPCTQWIPESSSARKACSTSFRVPTPMVTASFVEIPNSKWSNRWAFLRKHAFSGKITLGAELSSVSRFQRRRLERCSDGFCATISLRRRRQS
ncbi:FMN-linked oxidoreductase [Hymenopellis radicata]|nr:FMN-linked oxidoreductase [Hymenopellis radicata]